MATEIFLNVQKNMLQGLFMSDYDHIKNIISTTSTGNYRKIEQKC